MNNPLAKLEAMATSLPAREAGLVAGGWTLAAILIGVAGARTEIPPFYVAWAIAAAAAPGFVTLALLTHIEAHWARAFLIFTWVSFAGVATGVSGGFDSVLSATFALAPAFALRLAGRAAAGEAAFFAALGYVAAGIVAGHGEIVNLGPMPACIAGLAIVASGALIASADGVRKVTAVARPAPIPHTVVASAADDGERAHRHAAEIVAAQRRRAAELAHELRTPLNHVIGFADAMRQRLFGPMSDRYGEYADLIHASGRNMLDLVNGLLDLSRLDAGRYPLEIETFDFRPIAEESVRLAGEAAVAKSIGVTLDAAAELPVRADARALRQILVNLLANAVKFTPTGGAVTARVLARGRDFVIEVEDTGPGIPAAERARLGQAFERGAAGAGVEGFGLGLSLVRALAAAHGGRLTIHEAPGGGALVRVTAPIAGV